MQCLFCARAAGAGAVVGGERGKERGGDGSNGCTHEVIVSVGVNVGVDDCVGVLELRGAGRRKATRQTGRGGGLCVGGRRIW